MKKGIKIGLIAFGAVVLLSSAAIAIPKLFGNSPGDIATEVEEDAMLWLKLLDVHYNGAPGTKGLGAGSVGDGKEIGYKGASNNIETHYFVYEVTAQNGLAFWTAKNKIAVGNCPADNWWKIKSDGVHFEAKLPENSECAKLTPNFPGSKK